MNEVRLKIRELGESFAFAARREKQAGIRHPKSGCLKRMLVKKSGSGRAGGSEKLTGRRIAVLVMSRIVDTDAHGGGT